jgi:hypothetical protein
MSPEVQQQMFWNLGFLCVTYLPLQFIAFRKCRGARQILAALPLPFMGLMIAGAANPASYHDGSLFGIGYLFIYLPSVLWLGGVCAQPPQPATCPRCGEPHRAKAFQLKFSTRRRDKCGEKIPAANT